MEPMMQGKTRYVTNGETIKVSQQWAAECEQRGTTVSSSVWAYSGTGALAGPTLVTPLATVKLAATGSGTLTNTATLANGEVLKAYRTVVVASDAAGSVTA